MPTLQESNADHSKTLSRIRHDLRTPLNAIIGYSEMLQESAQDLDREELIPDLSRINSAGRKLLDLTEILVSEPEASTSDCRQHMQKLVETVLDLSKKLMDGAVEGGLESLVSDIKRIGSAAQRFRAVLEGGRGALERKARSESKVENTAPADDSSAESDGGGLLLVVDDNEMNRDLLGRILLRGGHKVMAAESGSKALALARLHAFDLVLLDIMMPEMDGYEVCRQLKAGASTCKIPVIFITAMGEVADEARGFAAGAVDYIAKPIKAPVVAARVKTHLELKRARESLEKQNELLRENARLRDDVERMTRHDLKSPLQAILSAPALLMQEDNLKPDQLEVLQMLEESGYRMLDIVNSSLDLYKMEKGAYQLNSVPVELVKVVNQIRGETRELIGSKRLKINILVRGGAVKDNDSFIVGGEEMLCYSMLSHLVKNAVEASPEGEQIQVGLDDRRQTAEIFIHNRGVIPKEVQPMFFGKYISSGKSDGKGLGSYTANLIAKTLGGTVDFESSHESGTMLIVRLPKYQPEPDLEKISGDTKSAAPTAYRPVSILVVEDYHNMLRIIRGMIQQMGFTHVLMAQNGSAALKVLSQEPVDLIVSDWNMPQMSGIELLRYIRSRKDLKDLPFIMVTCETAKEYLLEARDAGVSDYIIKPFAADTLKKKIARFFNRTRIAAV